MKLANRTILVLSLLCAALLGGLLAAVFEPQSVNAAPAALAFGPPVKLTSLAIPNLGVDGVTSTFTKIADIGPFTVENAASLVEVTHQGRLYADNFVSSTGMVFELRVDDQSPLSNTGQAMVRSAETNTYVASTFSGYFQNLPAGEHTVSLWARTSSGTADTIINPGNWTINDLIIKEYLPFGTTQLPLLMK